MKHAEMDTHCTFSGPFSSLVGVPPLIWTFLYFIKVSIRRYDLSCSLVVFHDLKGFIENITQRER